MAEAQADTGNLNIQDNNTVFIDVDDETESDPDLRQSQSLEDATEHKLETNTNNNEALTYYTSDARRVESP